MIENTLGICSARLRDPTTSILSCGKSILSELELNTQSNLSPLFWYFFDEECDGSPPSFGLAKTSQETWIFSCFATPYTFTCPGLQNGLTEKRENSNACICFSIHRLMWENILIKIKITKNIKFRSRKQYTQFVKLHWVFLVDE